MGYQTTRICARSNQARQPGTDVRFPIRTMMGLTMNMTPAGPYLASPDTTDAPYRIPIMTASMTNMTPAGPFPVWAVIMDAQYLTGTATASMTRKINAPTVQEPAKTMAVPW